MTPAFTRQESGAGREFRVEYSPVGGRFPLRRAGRSVPSRTFFSASAILLVAVMVTIAAGQSPSPNSPGSSPQPSGQQSSQPASPPAARHSDSVLQVGTHVVTVDVVATDSHGNVVRDLKQDEFEISDNRRQKIAQFAFIDKSAGEANANPSKAAKPRPMGFYTNQAKFEDLAMPPTVVLMDALNSDVGNLLETRRHMMRLLETLPANSPVAVFLLGQSLVVVQDFTSDPAVLRAAVDRAMRSATPLDQLPENDPNSASLVAFDENGGEEDIVSKSLEDFEKENYANIMDVRVTTTLDSLTAIARYLGGYPGRKNLVWVSSSFPISLTPDSDFGTRSGVFKGTRDYSEQVQETARALTDAQVAVYPVDARGLETSQVFGADQDTVLRRGSRSRSMTSQLNREDDARAMAQGTMDELAKDTGGKTCKNTNDLSGCVEGALKDSSSYYELAYYPQNFEWNGRFHSISVKTTRHGVDLKYRRGYFAQEAQALAKNQPPERRLQQGCKDLLPSTAIPISAQSVPSEKPDEIRYLMSVAPGALSLATDGQSHKLGALMATCVFSANNSSFQFTARDLSRTFSEADFDRLRRDGLHGYLDVPKAGTGRVRIAVLDLGSGLTGALDIRVHPEDFEKAAAPPATSQDASSRTPAPEDSPSPLTYSVKFQSGSGASGALDWSGDKLSYNGDLGVASTAPVYFHQNMGGKFHCEQGQLVPRDPGDARPDLHFSFGNPGGKTAVVDLTGSEPQYSGDLSVDPSAKPFFERLWYLCHCRAAP